jgi:hypothetical protein
MCRSGQKLLKKEKNKEVYLVDIPVKLNAASVIKHLSFGGSSSRLEGIARELTDMVLAVVRPRAIYMVSQARGIDRETVEVGDVRFTSRIMGKIFDTPRTVYPFITTIGNEVEELPVPSGDMWRQLCLDTIKTLILVSGVEYLSEYIKDKYSLDGIAHMNPGEIEDWPITQQKPLFSIFRGAEKQIGVTLTKGGAMKPVKSRSGILFPDNTGFLSCRFCTQPKCPGRRAAYSPEHVMEYLD